MNREAAKHLDKAVKLFARGDGFYKQAAAEVVAAQECDSGLTYAEIGALIGHSKSWVQRVVAWSRGSETETTTPFSDDGRNVLDRHTKQHLRDAPMEQVERIISTLPKERRMHIAAAANPDSYAFARAMENERVKNLTPAEHKEIEAAKERIVQPVREAVASFTALGVVGHLEQATEDLTQMISEQTLSAESVYRITEAHDRFVTELEVARGMAGLEAR